MNLEKLMSLKDGWYDGDGLAPDKDRLEEVWRRLFKSWPDGLSRPCVVPTQEGGLLFSWENMLAQPTVDYDMKTDRAWFHAWALDGGDIEREFVVTDEVVAEEMWVFAKKVLDEARTAVFHKKNLEDRT